MMKPKYTAYDKKIQQLSKMLSNFICALNYLQFPAKSKK